MYSFFFDKYTAESFKNESIMCTSDAAKVKNTSKTHENDGKSKFSIQSDGKPTFSTDLTMFKCIFDCIPSFLKDFAEYLLTKKQKKT